jgi:hypothetical protein
MKTLIEEYISTPKFQQHKQKVIWIFDKNQKYIDDVVQDFCYYYLQRPDKRPNIRKLYNLMIDKLGKEKRYVNIEFDDDFDNILYPLDNEPVNII